MCLYGAVDVVSEVLCTVDIKNVLEVLCPILCHRLCYPKCCVGSIESLLNLISCSDGATVLLTLCVTVRV